MYNVIRFVDVGSQVGVWPRSIPIGEVLSSQISANYKTPRRLHYDTKMQRMLVICSNIETYLPIQSYCLISGYGMLNTLNVIDILRNDLQTIPPETDDNINNYFPKRSIINCLYEWRFQSFEKVFSLIVLGMGDNPPGPDTPKYGQIVILACRISSSNKRTMRIKLIRKFQTKHPVFAIAKIDDRRLLYSWGNSLSMITFEPRSSEEHR